MYKMVNWYKLLLFTFVICTSVAGTSAADSQRNATTETPFRIEQDGISEKHVLDYLLNPKRYDKRLLPLLYTPVIVNVSVVLFTVSSPDESSLKYDVDFLLEQEWFDSRLQFPTSVVYQVLNGIHHQANVWLPDMNFHMHGDFKPTHSPAPFSLKVYRNGRVEYTTRRHLALNCEGMMNIFPFDEPLCTFSMESITYEKSDLKYEWKDNNSSLFKSQHLKTSNSYMERNRTFECTSTGRWRGNFSCLQVEMVFSRDRTFYFATIFIPGLVLVTSSFFTFFLEWDAVPARTIIGVTTMLNYFSTSNSFRRTLPDVSNLTAMNVWDGVCVCFVFASFVEFIIVNSMGRRKVVPKSSRNPGNCSISKITNDLDCTQIASSHPLLMEVLPKENEKNSIPDGQVGLAKTIDTIARFTFPSTFAMFLMLFFFYYSLNTNSLGIFVSIN